VSALGLGGYHLAMAGSDREGIRIAQAAIDAGVTFMD
jgi:aryl-alcohol dehydrogenase-like predicted oxidoreductase